MQNDSLDNEIMSLPETDLTYIQNGRQLIMNALQENDVDKVKSIKYKLETKFQNTDVMPFWLGERILLHLISGQYELLLNTDCLDSIQHKDYSRFLKPPSDNLYNRLSQYVYDNQAKIERNIDECEYSEKDKAFLKVFIIFILEKKESNQISQDDVNDVCDRFLIRYPKSEYDTFVRTNMRMKFVPSNWGYGFDFFSGTGQFKGPLNRYFTDHVPIGVAFDIQYQQYILYLRDYIGLGSKVAQEFDYKGTWPKDLSLEVFLPEASVGYVILDNNRYKMVPFIGISSMDISPPEQKKEEYDVGLDFVTTYTCGLNIDLKLSPSKIPIVSYNEESVWLIKFRLGINHPTYTNRDPRFDGTMVYFTIGFGGFGKKMLRDY